MKRTKILIVEDETFVAMDIQEEVEKLKCQVTDIVCTHKKVLSSIEQNEPDIVLMDIKLGKNHDGIEIVKEIQKSKNIPIIYITAFSDEAIMQRAFSTNPIGYIVKPFKPEELKTNIQLAIYKLSMVPPKEINPDYHYLGEGFYFDIVEQSLYYNDNFVKLGAKEKHLLSILIDANYAQVQFSDLEAEIWDGYKASRGALRTLVYRLKGKLGNNIINVTYGYGYSLKRPQ